VRRRPTIVEVAEAAGVSKSTVSLVLRDSPLVREETRAAVRAAMARTGYVYNRAAANLRGTGTGLIGLIINDLRNPFFTEFATAVQMALSARGHATVIANTDEDPDLQAQVVGAMIEHGVKGIVISPCLAGAAPSFEALAQAGIPALQVLRRVEGDGARFPFAAPDYAEGSRLAVAHLRALGARRLAFVGGIAGQAVTRERMSGLADAGAGLAPPVTLHGRATRGFGRAAAHLLAERHRDVEGVVCFNDLVALGMLRGFAEAGRHVGTALRVVGFDDIEEAGESHPPLSTVRCDIAGFGASVAQTILRWLETGAPPPPETRTPVRLILRASSLPQGTL